VNPYYCQSQIAKTTLQIAPKDAIFKKVDTAVWRMTVIEFTPKNLNCNNDIFYAQCALNLYSSTSSPFASNFWCGAI